MPTPGCTVHLLTSRHDIFLYRSFLPTKYFVGRHDPTTEEELTATVLYVGLRLCALFYMHAVPVRLRRAVLDTPETRIGGTLHGNDCNSKEIAILAALLRASCAAHAGVLSFSMVRGHPSRVWL